MKLSIRAKITLWFAAALVVIVAISYLVVLGASNQVIQKTIRDNLIETVEHNIDEIEYFDSIESMDLAGDVDSYLEYLSGYLEVDDDFLDEVNGVYTALYTSDGTLSYGENPIAADTGMLAFSDSQIQRIKVEGTLYYVFDRKLTATGLDGLWLRGVVSETQGDTQMNAITRTSLILLPALLVITILGGYLIARRMLRPIREISESASRISRGGDLKQRIEVGEGGDELHQLANNFNEMFERLDSDFEAQRQFVSDASHELRTPMAVITAECEYSLEEERTAEDYKEAITVIDRQGKKMSRLINDMLDFSRLELKAEQYEKSDVDFSALTISTCEDMALIRERGITLTCNAQADIHCIGNRDLLTRLLTNFITNAYRYGNDNGWIQVELTEKEDVITLTVADNGIGIAEDALPKIFDRFYQADNSRSNVGTGLGLAMVREIARFHTGEITAESELGLGSTFTFTMPKGGM